MSKTRSSKKTDQARLTRLVRRIRACRQCPGMNPPPVTGDAVFSRVMLIGQAPGDKEPKFGRPFAWTAGKTLFGWFQKAGGINEQQFRRLIYMAAVCRCFPGKNPGGGDRVPDEDEIAKCAVWLDCELALLKPRLVIPVGKLAISKFLDVPRLDAVIGENFKVKRAGVSFDLIPLPHPSGASPWHRTHPGKALLAKALRKISRHPDFVRTIKGINGI